MHKFLLVISVCIISVVTAGAQQSNPTEQTDVIRVDASLVQTSITVVDKKGAFVESLRPEDFELKIDGKPFPISFLSRVTAGTTQEITQLSATRRGVGTTNAANSESEIRGRTVIFFIDDLHLSAPSVQKTRQTILNFIANQMGPNDLVAIASASGQIGFLQQFTDHKPVLRAAVARLNHRPYTVVDHENVPMTEYTAMRIDQGDRDALSYYANQLLMSNNFKNPGGGLGPPAGGPVNRPSSGQQQRSSGMPRELAERQVKERANLLLKQANAVTTNTLASLESLMRSSAKREGRKLVFFISDGFFLNDRNTGFASKLHDVTDAAVRAGVVIYALDARGLVSTVDVTSNRADPEGKLSRSNIGEITASQDALNALAGDTGGRALFDSDKLSEAVVQALKETSNYYLVAWRPSTEEQKSPTFKSIEIKVPSRPELNVRIPKGYFVNAPAIAQTSAPAETNAAKPGENVVDAALKRTLSAASVETNVPTTVALTYVDTPDNGPLATASVQVAASALDYGPDGKQAAVDVAGVILNDSGKAAATFRTRLTVNPISGPSDNSGVVYNYKAKLTPGIYQVRTAVRDEKSQRVGSATQWIEIPDLASKKLTLSSLLLRPIRKGATASAPETQFSVDHHFSRTSQLNFFVFIYNASRNSSAKPDLTAQVEVFHHGKSIVSTPVRTLMTAGMSDLQRIPYAGQFQLESMPTGRYELQVTIVDRVANASVAQRVPFLIE
jgi:VWFA-related protein